MSQKRLYWLSQIFGWSIYYINEIFADTIKFGFDNTLIGIALINILLGILLTHFFRYVIRKYNWIKLPLPRLITRVLLVIAGLTLIFVLVNLVLDYRYIKDIWDEQHVLLASQYFISLAKPLLIWSLIYISYHYFEELKNDEVERIRLKSSIKESEGKVLKAQMNPHFMFNALNSIRALVLEDPAKAQLGITQLSNILRSSLIADRRTTISLKEELKTIEDYLGLEKVRYEERLQIKWDIAPETLSIQVPPMMLQTLVENAIKHGVQKAISWGFIEINSCLVNRELHIKIRNTGQLKSTESSSEVGGFGLKNTTQRLNILYGDEAKFEIYQEHELTVCAEITIPFGKNLPIQEVRVVGKELKSVS